MTDPNEKGLPPESLGAAADVAPGPGAEDLWWKPGWKDLVRAGGWRWILMIPAVGVLGLCVLAVLNPRYVGAFWWLGAKGIIWSLAIPAAVLADIVRRVTSARTDPFCIHCGYALTGLPEWGTCPECGSAYTRQIIDEYRRDPKWFIHRYKAQKELPQQESALPPPVIAAGRRKRSRDGT